MHTDWAEEKREKFWSVIFFSHHIPLPAARAEEEEEEEGGPGTARERARARAGAPAASQTAVWPTNPEGGVSTISSINTLLQLLYGAVCEHSSVKPNTPTLQKKSWRKTFIYKLLTC